MWGGSAQKPCTGLGELHQSAKWLRNPLGNAMTGYRMKSWIDFDPPTLPTILPPYFPCVNLQWKSFKSLPNRSPSPLNYPRNRLHMNVYILRLAWGGGLWKSRQKIKIYGICKGRSRREPIFLKEFAQTLEKTLYKTWALREISVYHTFHDEVEIPTTSRVFPDKYWQ